jgi:hypothetical protein
MTKFLCFVNLPAPYADEYLNNTPNSHVERLLLTRTRFPGNSVMLNVFENVLSFLTYKIIILKIIQ